MSTSLCYELYDYIISFLQDDNQSLRSCSLVCRAWVPASQYHLFHHLTLASSRQFHTARPLAYPWVSMEITFPPLLKKLSFLKELEFNFSPRRSSELKINWPTIPPNGIKEALSSIPLESLTFRHFSFNSIVDIIEILFACQNLKNLHLYNVDILDTLHLSGASLESILSLESLLKHPGGSKKPNIERLTLRSNKATSFISILLHPRSPVELSSLHHLNINVSSQNYFYFAELLRCIPRLKFLEMDIDSSFDYEALLNRNNIIHLNFVPSLVSLSLQVRLLVARVDPIPWMVTFLSAIVPQEDIFLTFILDKPPPIFTIDAFENTLAEWRRLDHLLTQSPFSGLRRIRLVFVLDNPDDDQSLRQVADEFTAQLQGLTGRGVLEVDVCHRHKRKWLNCKCTRSWILGG